MTEMNLLPWREKRRKDLQQAFLVTLAFFSVLTLILCFAMHAGLTSLINQQETVNQFLTRENHRLDERIEDIKNLKKEKKQILDRMNIVRKLEADRPAIVSLFDKIPRLIPNGVSLTQLERKDNHLSFKGNAESNTRVSSFMRKLEGFHMLSDPQLIEIKATDEKNDVFQLKTEIKSQVGMAT